MAVASPEVPSTEVQEDYKGGQCDEHDRSIREACSVEFHRVNSIEDVKLLQTYFDISSTLDLHKQVYIFNGSRSLGRELSSGASSPKRQGHLHRWLKTSDIKLLQTDFDI